MTLTSPEPIFSVPISTTFAALTIASAASMFATSPLVSTMPSASIPVRSFFSFGSSGFGAGGAGGAGVFACTCLVTISSTSGEVAAITLLVTLFFPF